MTFWIKNGLSMALRYTHSAVNFSSSFKSIAAHLWYCGAERTLVPLLLKVCLPYYCPHMPREHWLRSSASAFKSISAHLWYCVALRSSASSFKSTYCCPPVILWCRENTYLKVVPLLFKVMLPTFDNLMLKEHLLRTGGTVFESIAAHLR